MGCGMAVGQGWELEEPDEPCALSAVLLQDRGNLPAHVWVQTRPVTHG